MNYCYIHSDQIVCCHCVSVANEGRFYYTFVKQDISEVSVASDLLDYYYYYYSEIHIVTINSYNSKTVNHS